MTNYLNFVASACFAAAAALVVTEPASLEASVLPDLITSEIRDAAEKGGTITLVVDGRVTLAAPILITTNTTIDATGHSLVFDGGDSTRHFIVTNAASLRLINLELVNGLAVGATGATNQPGSPGLGGSIQGFGCTVELVSCKLFDNRAMGGIGGLPIVNRLTTGGDAYGGAVYVANGRMFVTNCSFLHNSCTGGRGQESGLSTAGGSGSGGAIYASNSVVVMNGVTFSNNVSAAGELDGRSFPQVGNALAYGGAFFNDNSMTVISRCVFAANQAIGTTDFMALASGNGGALFHRKGSLEIQDTLFARNMASGRPGIGHGFNGIPSSNAYGGAVYNESGELKIRNSSLIANVAQGGTNFPTSGPLNTYGGIAYGGGIYSANDGTLALVNCTLEQNIAQGGSASIGGEAYGGGIRGSNVDLLNVTLSGNSAKAGERFESPGIAARAMGSSVDAIMTVRNTILSCSLSETNVSAYSVITDAGHNICSDASAHFTAPSSRNELDPKLGQAGDNGGPTPTVALLPGSPAIDAGDNVAALITDQRGVARPQGWSTDIGAFELMPELALSIGREGIVSLHYAFQAAITNSVMASSNMITWLQIGTKVSDASGAFDFEDRESPQFHARFYTVKPQVPQ